MPAGADQWSGRDLNSRPLQCDCSALPAELPPQPSRIVGPAWPAQQGLLARPDFSTTRRAIANLRIRWQPQQSVAGLTIVPGRCDVHGRVAQVGSEAFGRPIGMSAQAEGGD